MLPGVANVGQHAIERVSMKVAPAHLDDRAEAAVEGASARGFHHIHPAPQHGIAAEDTGVALGQTDFIALERMHGARRVLMPAIRGVIRQPLNRSKALAAFERAQQLAEGNLAFAADNVIDAASGFHIGFGREAGIVAAHDDVNAGPQRAHQLNDAQRRLALEGHDGQANHVRLDFAYQPLHRFAHRVLHQDQVGRCHSVVRIDISRQRTQCSIGHPHRDRRHVLEGVGHGKEKYIHGTVLLKRWSPRPDRLAYMLHRNWRQLTGRMGRERSRIPGTRLRLLVGLVAAAGLEPATYGL